jgi:hypothetical protein
MPKAAMYEDNLLPLPEDQIRLSRKVRRVQPKPTAEAMHKFPHKKLGFHPFALNPAHILRALFRC